MLKFCIQADIQDVYTTAKFEGIQEELNRILYLVDKEDKEDDIYWSYIMVENTSKCFWIDPIGGGKVQEKQFQVNCEWRNFEFKGIDCRHILKVL